MVEGLAKDTSGRSRENFERCDGCTGAFGGSPITSTQIGLTLWVCNAFSSRRWSLMASEGSDDASAFRCFLYEFLNFSISSEYWSLMKVANVRALLLLLHRNDPLCQTDDQTLLRTGLCFSPWLWKLERWLYWYILGSIQTQSKALPQKNMLICPRFLSKNQKWRLQWGMYNGKKWGKFLDDLKSSRATFICIALYTIQIVLEQG